MTARFRRRTRGPVPASAGPAALILCATLIACQSPAPREESGAPLPGGPPADAFPVGWSMGSFDARFGISADEFRRTAAEAVALWEKAAGRTLFRFDRDAPFTLSLVYDERQERTNEARKVKARIDSRGRSYDALVWQHARRLERMKEHEERYEAAEEALRKRLEAYNAAIESWNERGGAPAGEYERLNREQEAIRGAEPDLGRLRDDLNAEVEAVNDLVSQINELASANNIEVTYFNGRFVESREFEQGVFDGKGITIYQFTGLPDLRLALVHEFGHALGFGHVDDPAAVMHYKMGRQDLANPTLSPADLDLVRRKFSGE